MTETAKYVDAAQLELLISQEETLVIDFTASWCGPCKVVGPLMDELAAEFAGKSTIVKVDIDSNKNITKALGIRSIPAVVYFKQGEEVQRVVGVKPIEDFRDILNTLLSSAT